MEVLTFKIGGLDENESQYLDFIKEFTAVSIGISIVDGYTYYKNPDVQMTGQVMVPLIKCRQNDLRFDSSGGIT